MATINFQLLKETDGTAARDTLGGSGLAFYGSAAGASVQVGEYQDKTYVANADGSTYTDVTNNTKFVTNIFPSGQMTLGHAGGTTESAGLSGIKTFQGTLGIEFSHTSAVNIQNAQLRIYDRSNVNYPASGVNTKVAEIINHNGATSASQGADGHLSTAVGSGDILWWGEPWPLEMVGAQNYFTNKNGVVFRNGVNTGAVNVNGDSRLSSAAITGSYDTVGGTGIIVPLADSPGSGQRGLQRSEVVSASGQQWPKWTQYVNTNTRQALYFGSTANNFDNSALDENHKTFGGTGVDLVHTWSVALSAAPLSVGAKDEYGLYVSVEYL